MCSFCGAFSRFSISIGFGSRKIPGRRRRSSLRLLQASACCSSDSWLFPLVSEFMLGWVPRLRVGRQIFTHDRPQNRCMLPRHGLRRQRSMRADWFYSCCHRVSVALACWTFTFTCSFTCSFTSVQSRRTPAGKAAPKKAAGRNHPRYFGCASCHGGLVRQAIRACRTNTCVVSLA